MTDAPACCASRYDSGRAMIYRRNHRVHARERAGVRWHNARTCALHVCAGVCAVSVFALTRTFTGKPRARRTVTRSSHFGAFNHAEVFRRV